jgi:hypothetical protein
LGTTSFIWEKINLPTEYIQLYSEDGSVAPYGARFVGPSLFLPGV